MTGVIVGRFQTFHNGHKYLIDKACEMYDTVLIIIGSSNEYQTIKNPYNIIDRFEMINYCYADQIKSGKIIVAAIPDRLSYGDDTGWGQYLMNHIVKILGYHPDAIIYGNDAERNLWFNKEILGGTKEVVIDRHFIEISATQVRNLMREGKRDEWEKVVPVQIHCLYEKLRKNLLRIN